MIFRLTGTLDPDTKEVVLPLPRKILKGTQIANNNILTPPERLQKIIWGIKNDVSCVLEKNDFEEIVNYIRRVYVAQEDNVSQDIKDLLTNSKFRTYIDEYIGINLPNILNNDSIYSFEEISFFVFLLGLGEYNNVLIDLNTYDFDKISSLFDEYIKNIVLNLPNLEKTNLCFNSFMLLLELINKLSILDQIDSDRKPLIIKLVSILEEKITQLEYNLLEKKALNSEKNNLLQHFLGKLSINFSHTFYVETKDRNLNDILCDFLKIVEKQTFGYMKSFSSDFGNNLNNKNVVYQTFLGNMAYTVSIMLSKIEKFEHEEVLKNDIFKNIVNLFLNNTNSGNKLDVDSLDELNSICNDVYVSIYNDNSQASHDLGIKKNGREVIKDFISSTDKVNDFQIESIHHLVMFLPEITLEEYLEIGNFLITIPKFNNYNFEFFKLKTLDIIISKIPNRYIDDKIKNFLDKLVVYVENNKIASQLLTTYSRLYLSIAFYYSELFDEKCQEKAMEYFSVFLKMGGGSFNFEKYGKNLDTFYYNLGLYKLNTSLCSCLKSGSYCDPSKEGNCNFSCEQIIKFGESKINDYRKNFEIRLKNDLDSILSDLLENALNQNGIEDSKINEKISKVLSNKIFHGIAETHIIDINNDIEFIENIILHNGISTFQIDLFNGYRLLFVFPKIYKDVFKEIFDDENYYIVKNIKNIISSYLKRKDLYMDHNTGLPNELRLKTIISHQGPELNMSFISIKLNTLKTINNGYGYELGDKYLKKVSEALSSIDGLKGNVFRLAGARVGIVVKDAKNLGSIIKSIKDIRFDINGTEYKLDSFIGVVANDNSDRIIDKSNAALDRAKSTSDGVFYYHDDINNSDQNRGLLEYLNRLDKAMEEDRVIPFAQPIFDVKTRALYKKEILMRVKIGDGEFDSPFRYLQSAEKFGRLIPIFNLMLRKVFEFASKNEGTFSINLSGDDLKNDELLHFILKTIGEFPIDSSRITFEILEGEWNEGDEHLKTIQALKRLGFKIAMDDFGANNSNINRLLDLLKEKQVDYLKIDGKIIKSLVDEDGLLSQIARELLEGVIKAAHSAGVKVIAEFVENEKIAMICEFLGIDYLQGYHLGEPGQLVN